MNRRIAWTAAALAAVVFSVALIVLWPNGESRLAEPSPDVTTEISTAVPEAGEDVVSLELYFPGEDDVLHVEERNVPVAEDPQEAIFIVASAVLDGPTRDELRPILPADVTIGSVDLDAFGTAFVGLESAAYATPPIAGSNMEMLALYSLVNSVVLNVDGVDALVLLWNGQQLATLAGHIDTRNPIEPRTDLWPQGDGRGAALGDRLREAEPT
jgi:hypothetical protein